MANWTTEPQPFGANHAPLLTGWASDNSGPIPIAVDKATGAIFTESVGTAANVDLLYVGGQPINLGQTTKVNSLPVTIASDQTIGGGTQYAEGATTAPGTGTLSIARYMATPPSLTDGELYGLQLDSSGNLKVTGSLSVGGTTDNSAFTAGTSTGTPSMGFYHSTIDTVTDGRAAAVAITSKRAMMVNLQNASGTEIGTSSNPVQVSLANTAANSTAVKVDGTGGTFPTSYTSVVNAGNSSTATLGSNATFTGTGVSVLPYSRITVQVVADQSSAANGVQLQFSEDNSNWTDASLYSYTSGGSAPNSGQVYGVSARGQYFRVVYTNGASAQGSFALQTILHPHNSPGDLVSMSVVPNSTNHALLTKASIVGLTTGGGGGFVDVKVNPSGTLTVDASNSTGLVLAAGTALIGKVGLDQTTPGTTNAVSLAQIGSTTTATGNGVVGAGVQRVAIASDNTAFSVNATLSAETTKVIGTVRTADGSGNLLTSTGNALDVNIKTSAASNISTNLAQVNGATTLAGNGASGTGALRVTVASDSTGQIAPAANSTSTGTAIYNNTALSSTKAAANANPGNLYGYHIYNPNGTTVYVQLFNLASASVTVGTTAPTAVIAVPGGGWADATPATPIAFTTALTIAATTTATGSGAPTTGLLVNLWYK